MPATQEQLALANDIAGYIAYKAVSSTPTFNPGHGPGGLFANPALERDLFSAMVLPWTGLQYILPVKATTVTDPLDGIITGVTAGSGTNPVGVCDDPPTSGTLKLCEHSYPLGRFSLQTRVLDISRGNRLVSRGEHTDFQVFGGPLADNSFAPNLGGTFSLANAANDDIAKAMLEFTVDWLRNFSRILYTGNPQTNNTSGGGYKEFYGLNMLINTGYKDAQTNQACPAADSLVTSFSNANVRQNPSLIVDAITSVYYQLMIRAAQSNLTPVKWAIVMPLSLFFEITKIWPVGYLTVDVTNVPTGSTNFIDSSDAVAQRDLMRGDLQARTGQYLTIMGQKVPVVIDDAITETRVNGDIFSSSIYFVPLVAKGQPVTFIEYLDYDAVGVMQQAQAFGAANFKTTDNGRFFLHMKPPQNWCVQLMGLTEPRLKLRTPYLAARIDNVGYSHAPNILSGYNDSPSYYRNGGRTNYVGFQPQSPSYYPPV